MEALKQWLQLKKNLIDTKNKIDNLSLIKKRQIGTLDPFKKAKKSLSLNCKMHVSNAWLKGYELMCHIGAHTLGKIHHFDNGALPGGFILSFGEYCRLHDIEYTWNASSLCDQASDTCTDDYNLFKNYPRNWIQYESQNNGDTSSMTNVVDIIVRKGRVYNLYTSDVGFDMSNDYVNQEKLYYTVNCNQIFLGLNLLMKGGIFIIKNFTFFEAHSLYTIDTLSTLFDSFEIYKPLSSKRANSEVYLIGIGYYPERADDLCKYLASKHIAQDFDEMSKQVNLEVLAEKYYNVANKIFGQQITTLNKFYRNIPSHTENDEIRQEYFRRTQLPYAR